MRNLMCMLLCVVPVVLYSVWCGTALSGWVAEVATCYVCLCMCMVAVMIVAAVVWHNILHMTNSVSVW